MKLPSVAEKDGRKRCGPRRGHMRSGPLVVGLFLLWVAETPGELRDNAAGSALHDRSAPLHIPLQLHASHVGVESFFLALSGNE